MWAGLGQVSEECKCFLMDPGPDLIVADEAHVIKVWKYPQINL